MRTNIKQIFKIKNSENNHVEHSLHSEMKTRVNITPTTYKSKRTLSSPAEGPTRCLSLTSVPSPPGRGLPDPRAAAAEGAEPHGDLLAAQQPEDRAPRPGAEGVRGRHLSQDVRRGLKTVLPKLPLTYVLLTSTERRAPFHVAQPLAKS